MARRPGRSSWSPGGSSTLSPDLAPRPAGTPARLGRRSLLLAPLLLAACGFAPAYAPGGPGDRLRGRVAVETPETPDGTRLRAALEDRLGPPGPDAALLAVEPAVATVQEGVLPDRPPARERFDGRAAWRLAGPTGAVLARGEAEGFTGATIAGPAVSVRAAGQDARERLMVLLADRIVGQLLLLPPEALP